jgi:uncharacterized protein
MGGGADEVKETAYEKALADVAYGELQNYKSEIVPFRNSWIDDVTRDTGTLENRVAGQVNADVAQRKPRALPVGVDPSSGAAMNVAPSLAVGNFSAKAAVDATQAVRNLRATGMQAGLNMMRGESTDAQTGMQSLAADSVNKAIGDAQNKQDTKETLGSSLTSAAFGGAAMYKNRKTPTQPATGTGSAGLEFSLYPS